MKEKVVQFSILLNKKNWTQKDWLYKKKLLVYF